MKIKILNELLIIILLTGLLVFVVFITPASALRAVLGFPALLLFPGYALLSALFPGRDTLSKVEWIAFTLGVSIAVVSLIGFILNYTPWGITLNSALIANAAFTIITAAAAWVRRYRRDKENGFIIRLDLKLPFNGSQRLADRVISGLLFLAIAGSAVTLIYTYAAPKVGERFTEFYILGPGGKAADYTREMVAGQEGSIIVGIINRQGEAAEYRVTAVIDGRESGKMGPVKLPDGKKWEEQMSFTPDRAGDNQTLELNLFINDKPAPGLKPLRIRINVKTPRERVGRTP